MAQENGSLMCQSDAWRSTILQAVKTPFGTDRLHSVYESWCVKRDVVVWRDYGSHDDVFRRRYSDSWIAISVLEGSTHPG
jgi:hypothetical protein